jgi:hypothetical protein
MAARSAAGASSSSLCGEGDILADLVGSVRHRSRDPSRGTIAWKAALARGRAPSVLSTPLTRPCGRPWSIGLSSADGESDSALRSNLSIDQLAKAVNRPACQGIGTTARSGQNSMIVLAGDKKGARSGRPGALAPMRLRREGTPALCRRPWPFERGADWPFQMDAGTRNWLLFCGPAAPFSMAPTGGSMRRKAA